MFQTERQIVRLMVRRGAEAKPVEWNIEHARQQVREAKSGEWGPRLSVEVRGYAGVIADVICDQLGMRAGDVMTDEFAQIMADADEAGADYPFLDAILAIGGYVPAAA